MAVSWTSFQRVQHKCLRWTHWQRQSGRTTDKLAQTRILSLLQDCFFGKDFARVIVFIASLPLQV